MSSDDASDQLRALAGELQTLVGRLRRRMREQADPGDLTPSQTAVLVHLEREGPATVTALARIEGVRSQSMGATVSTLEEAGLLSGRPDPNDGRQTLYGLTPACRAWIDQNRAARRDWLTAAIAKLSEPEQAALAAVVPLLKRIVE